jgi:hypothetical protein
MAKEEVEIQRMIGRLIEIGRYDGMEMNVNEDNENLKANIRISYYDGLKTTEEYGMFKIFGLRSVK